MDLVIQLEPNPLPTFPGGARQPTEPMRERRGEADNMRASKPDGPKAGLFTQTVIPSPIIQWIMPVRLRSKHRNDVAFIGERRLQIKEAVSSVHLENAVAKTDFDANIRAAKVINVGTELPWESQMKFGAGNMAADNDPELQENFPPQILLLSLDSRELVFLYYSGSDLGRFIHYRRPLPSDVSSFERFGHRIAVDPRSRAVAASAPCDYFGVLMLKRSPVLQSQMAQNRLDPISEERFFRVDGDILFMEFLYPTPEDGDRIILLLLVARDQTTQAICYDWDANTTLRHSTPRIVTRSLPSEHRLPSIVVPSTKRSSFMLATSTSLVMYKNKLDPHTQPVQYPLSIPDNGSQRSPLCTRWARPLRNLLHNQWHDDLYLCREDGTLFYVEIGNEGDVESQIYLGQLDCDVDTAFDTLDIGYEGADLIAAGGSMGDGGLFIQKAQDQPQCVQRFMNWSPVTDSVVIESTTQSQSAADTADGRLFACHASTVGQGDLVELRRGIEAQIGLVVPLEELSSAREIWTMADTMNGGVNILTSDPMSSLLFYLPADFEEEICAVDESDSGLDFSSHTLAAGCTPSDVVIQVTEKAIHLGAPDRPHYAARLDYGSNQSVVVAAVSGPESLVITAVRSQDGIHLHLMTVISSGEQHQPQIRDIGHRVKIDEEPVCALIESFGPARFIFVGTGDGNVLAYRIDNEAVFFHSNTSVAVGKGDDISKAIESLATVSTAAKGSSIKSTLFCGLRSGFLVPFEVAVDSGNFSTIEMKQASPRRLGQTSVKVQSRGRFALSTCAESFWQVSSLHDDPECTLERIWITDQNNPAYFPRNIHSFTISNVFDPNSDGLFNSLFCVADGQLLICTLDQSAKPVPRRISLPGSASRVAYSKHLRSLVVAYTRTELDTDCNPIRRLTTPFIEFVDPDSQEPVIRAIDTPEDGSCPPWRPQGAAGERISSIMEWMPEKDGQAYHLIVIGTSRKNQKERGRVIFLQASRDPSNPSQIKCSVRSIQKFKGPVHAIAPYGPLTLMVSAGNDIIPLETKWSEARGTRIARYSLLSPASSITVREPYLYLSTTRQSMVVLKVSDDRLVLHAHDHQKLDGLSHAHLEEPNFSLTSSRGGRVSLLTEAGITRNDKMLPNALAEAHLPASVMKLIPGPNPSPASSFSPLVYGTTITGAVYRFLVLNDKEWRLLRLLQDLCIRDPVICPFTPKKKRRNPVEAESLNLASRMHIDGDILGRLAEHDAGYLENILTTTDFDDPLSPNKGSAAATLERFKEASEGLLGRSSNQAEEVMRWLRRLLHVGF